MNLKDGLKLIAIIFMFGGLYGLWQQNRVLELMGEMTGPGFWTEALTCSLWNMFTIICQMLFFIFLILSYCVNGSKRKRG